MKKCEKCGQEINDTVKFCPHCGTAQSGGDSGQTGPKAAAAPKPAAKGGPKKNLYVIAGAAVLAVILLVMLFRPKNMKITPTDYVKVSCTGLNGEGKARLTFDSDSFLAAVKAEKELKPAQESELEGLLAKAEQYFQFSEDSGLSNGDKIKIESDMPSDYLKSYKVDIKNEDLSYTVGGLTDVQNVSLNDYYVAEFYGFEGYGYASCYLDYEGLYKAVSELVRNVDDSDSAETYIRESLYGTLYGCVSAVEISQSDMLSNGDKVTMSCPVNAEANRIDKYGIVFTSEEAEYKVDGLEEIETVELEDYLTAEISGFDGDGYARIGIDEEKLAADFAEIIEDTRNGYSAEDVAYQISSFVNYNFTVQGDKTEGLSNGDEIQITAEPDGEETYVSSVGVALVGGETTVKVDSLEDVVTVELGDFLTASFEGYNGAGDVVAALDEEKLNQAVREAVGESRGGYTGEEAVDEVYYDVLYNVQISADKETGLTNGDEVKLSVTPYDGSIYLSDLGMRFNSGEMTVTAEGLAEPEEADLMDILTVSFSGICPDVYVERTLNEESPLYAFVSRDSFYAIPDRIHAVNGETLDITLEYDNTAALRAGYKITNNQKSYTIDGLDTYDYSLNADDTAFQEIIERNQQELPSVLMDEESGLLDSLSGGKGMILWNEMTIRLNKLVKFYADRSYGDFNRTALVFEVSLPIMQQNETVDSHSVYTVSYFTNITESAGGTLNVGEEKRSYFFYSMADVEQALAEIPDSISREEGSDCARTETAAEEAAAEQETETGAETETEAETEAGAKVQEADGAVSAAAIPEIDIEVAANAAKIIEYEGHRYYRFDAPTTWQKAVQMCEQAGGWLVTVSSWTEQSILQDLIAEGELDGYWIGATDEEMEGCWKWANGEPFVYEGWDGSQPDNYNGEENYAFISKSYGSRWNDCTADVENIGFILEVAAETDTAEEYLAENGTLLYQGNMELKAWCADAYYGENCYGVLTYDTSNNGWSKHKLNGKYARLTGTTAVYSEAASGVSMDFAVFGDGKLLYRQRAITRETAPQALDIDVSGVDVLTIVTANQGETNAGLLLLDHAKLYPAEEAAETQTARTNDLVWIDSGSCEEAWGFWQDAYGMLHDGYVRLDAGEDGYVAWNLNGEYTTFSGKLVCGRRTGAYVAMKAEIYGDDELLFSAEDLNRTADPVEFSVDVTGKRVLKVVTDDPAEGYDAYLYLSDDVLTRAAEAAGDAEDAGSAEAAGDGEAAEPLAALDAKVLNQVSAMADYGDHQYYLFETATTWSKAEQFCQTVGGHLAAITTPLEQRRIELLLKKAVGSSYWIGGSDEKTEGLWSWSSGEEMDYTRWRSGEPSNSDAGDNLTENYLEIYTDGDWNDNSAKAERGFILELSHDADTVRNYRELAELSWQERLTGSDGYEYHQVLEDKQGNEHISTYALDASNNAWATYELNGEFTELGGVLSTYRETDQNAWMSIGFFGDGKLLYSRNGISGRAEAEPFTVDVTGVKTLTIKTFNTGERSYGWLLLNEAVLTLAETPAECATVTRLNDLQLVNSNDTEFKWGLFEDTYGELYEDAWRFNASNQGAAVYLLGGGYTELSLTICAGADTKSEGVAAVEIYGDDRLIYTQEGMTRETAAASVTLDVTGVNILKVATGCADEVYDSCIYLTGDSLK